MLLNKLLKKLNNRKERGIALVESLIAVAILGGGVLAMILAMSGGALAARENNQQVTAQSLARSQMEYTKDYAYDSGSSTYPTISSPTGYGISVGVSAVPGGDSAIQKITANITRDGMVIMTVEDYKVNR